MFVGDEFDEVDLAVDHDGPPDGVTLESNVQSSHFRSKIGLPQRRDTQPPLQTHVRPQVPPSWPAQPPQTPSAASANILGQSIKAESTDVSKLQNRSTVQSSVAPNRQSGVSPSAGANQNQADLPPTTRPLQNSAPSAASGSDHTPSLESSSMADSNAPVGFFTARVAESLQKGAALPSNVPTFNPHLESPSIRKTAGVDHTKSKPVRTESIGAASPAAANVAPRTNFVNPQADKTRKVGMPMATGSPLQNRGSYRPPQMKRPSDGLGVP